MTTSRRQPLKERREARAARSAENKRTYWEQRFAAAETPLDLLKEATEMLRARVVQFERKALARQKRAKTDSEKADAAVQLAAARDEIRRICSDVATEIARFADQIDTGRR